MTTDRFKGRHPDTPCLILDRERLVTAIATMQCAMSAVGKGLRPHVKTHKCSVLARMQLEAGAAGLCCAKLSEAGALANKGITGVLVTGPVAGKAKLTRLMDHVERDPSLMIVADDPSVIRDTANACRERGLVLNVLVDMDVGLGRTGVQPRTAPDVAKLVADLPSLRFRGVQAYAGQVQHVHGHAGRRSASLACMARAMEAVQRIRDAGLACDIVTGGGTGTWDIDIAIPGLTDIQAGSYVLMDTEYAAIGGADGSQGFDDFRPSLSLLTTVVSVNLRGEATVDAGLKTLYHHGAAPVVLSHPGATYDWFGDEYGRFGFDPEKTDPRPGDLVELLVSHCDPTVNLFDRFHVVSDGEIVDEWDIDLRGLSR